jgi:hypothetical protein
MNLYGIHDSNQDWGGLIRDFGMTGWAVISESIGDDPTNQSSVDYRWLAAYGVTPIVRLNYSHHGEGTIPLPNRFNAFAQRAANFVNASNGCRHFVIGNEPNLRAERCADVPITPASYAECFNKCRLQIKHRSVQHNVIPAAIAPYNADTGWCLDYWREMLSAIVMDKSHSSMSGMSTDGGADGLALHTYSRGPNPSSITSEDKMDAPYQAYHNGFRAYQDFLALVPAIMRALPVYITETDQLGPWADRNSGWVQGAYAEINDWNGATGHQGIHCLALYRWQNYDQWGFCRKNGVIDDFRVALALGYQAPLTPTLPTPEPPDPEPPRPTPAPEPDPIDWDPRLTVRGCTLQHALMPTDIAPLVTVAKWFDRDQAQGRVSVYVRLLDEQGRLKTGVPVTWFWSSGSETKLTERKSDPWLESKGLGREYSLDFAMYEVAPSYGIRIEGEYRGDIINGCGLGSIEQPDYKIHTAYFFEWQLSSEGITVPIPPTPTPPVTVRGLLWPVVGPITQHFGEGDAQFGQRGHNGIDIAVPEGTRVEAICAGEVMYTGYDASYGLYVRVYHPSIHSHSFYAHLVQVDVEVGQVVEQGERLGKSGNTGNSTGPHLHFELRAGNRDAYYQMVTFGYTSGRYNPTDAYALTGSPIAPAAS